MSTPLGGLNIKRLQGRANKTPRNTCVCAFLRFLSSSADAGIWVFACLINLICSYLKHLLSFFGGWWWGGSDPSCESPHWDPLSLWSCLLNTGSFHSLLTPLWISMKRTHNTTNHHMTNFKIRASSSCCSGQTSASFHRLTNMFSAPYSSWCFVQAISLYKRINLKNRLASTFLSHELTVALTPS